LATFKTFKVREGVKVILRLELYNAFNRVTFGAPTRSILNSTTLGTITT
jgi:hypothetical protein